MLYTFIIVTILIVALITGMYFSSYQNINEKLALKKKYLRSENIFFKRPKIKSKISYSFGTIACLLLVFIILNDPNISYPFERISSAEVFNDTIDNLIVDNQTRDYNVAISMANLARDKIKENLRVIKDESDVFFITENSLVKVSGNELSNHQDKKIEKLVFNYSNSKIMFQGLLDCKDQILSYGTWNSEGYTESIIYVHNKMDLTIQKTIYLRGAIHSIKTAEGYLYCITTNDIIKNENYYGKMPALKFSESDKFQTSNYKDIYYIPNNNIKNVLGFIKISLNNNKFLMKTLLLSNYFLANYNNKIYISVNQDLIINDSENKSFIIEYNFFRMRIEKSNKIEGNVYNDFLSTESQGFVVSTITKRGDQNLFKIYHYDKRFYLKRTYELKSQDYEILIQDLDFSYFINRKNKTIKLLGGKSLPGNEFPIVSNELMLEDIISFNKLFGNKVLMYNHEDDKIILKQYDIINDVISEEMEIDTNNNTLDQIAFDSYYYNGKVYHFINICLQNDLYNTYYVIPYIENRFILDYSLTFSTKRAKSVISHFFIDNYFVIITKDKILLFPIESVNEMIEIPLD